jgi:hypothetical protein
VSDAEIVEENARLMRREIMGRISVVEHELEVIEGQLDDLPLTSRGRGVDAELAALIRAASAFRELLVRRGWR